MTATQWKKQWLIDNTDIPANEIYALDFEETEIFYNLEQAIWMPSIAA